MSKRALGKGLDALFTAPTEQEAEPKAAKEDKIHVIPLELIEPNPDQPRKQFRDASIQELADSIQEKGVLQPVLLQKSGDKYILVAGERRFRAAQLAEVNEIPAILVSCTEEERMEIALIENLQREDLLPIDEAVAYERLMKTSGYSQDELAQKIGKKRSTIANSLRLLKLSDTIQEALQEGQISPGHARAILSVSKDMQEQLFSDIIGKGYSVRQAEQAAAALQNPVSVKKAGQKGKEKIAAELREMEQKLMDVFGTKIAIKGSVEGGRIEMTYYSMEDLERIYEIVDQLSNK